MHDNYEQARPRHRVIELSEQKASAIAAESLVHVTLTARNAAFDSLKTDLSWAAQLAASLSDHAFVRYWGDLLASPLK